ncbi:LD-carboxypeptidase [Bacteroidota bacterium]
MQVQALTKIMVIWEKNAYFETMMQLPPYLSTGDKVGIAAPARWVEKGDMEYFIEAAGRQGWSVAPGSIYSRYNQFSGKDEDRLRDLQLMLDDPEIKAIFCARGGYGTARLLAGIDLNAFAVNPKWIAGFSDITALHSCILMKTGKAVLHSAMPYTIRDVTNMDDLGLESLFGVLRGEFPNYEVTPDHLNRIGRGRGILLGGNLSVLYSLTGTDYQLPTRGAILFLEDVDEYLYHIDRMIQNLKMAGMLEHLNGLIVGGMTEMRDNKIPYGKNAYEIIREAVEPYEFPVCFGFPAGHTSPNLSMVFGRQVDLEVKSETVRMDYIV